MWQRSLSPTIWNRETFAGDVWHGSISVKPKETTREIPILNFHSNLNSWPVDEKSLTTYSSERFTLRVRLPTSVTVYVAILFTWPDNTQEESDIEIASDTDSDTSIYELLPKPESTMQQCTPYSFQVRNVRIKVK